jgi:CTP synthase (UTP-ammonia lyase)
MSRAITVLMDLPAEDESHRFTVAALDHAIAALDAPVSVHVVHTDAVDTLGDGVVIGPGSPYLDPAAAEQAIQTAREKGLPLVGT